MTPELINYVKKIVSERGISKDQMTREAMGDVLREAMRRMDKAFTRYLEDKDVQVGMAEAIYKSIPEGKTKLIKNPYKIRVSRKTSFKDVLKTEEYLFMEA